MHPLKDKACIVGVGETAYTRGTDRSVINQMLRAAMAALDDAGLEPHDIDGIVTATPTPPVEHLAANLGIPDLHYSASSNIGGAAAVAALQTGAMAIALGLANTVLVPVGWNAFSGGVPVLHAVRAGGAGPMACMVGDTLPPPVPGSHGWPGGGRGRRPQACSTQ